MVKRIVLLMSAFGILAAPALALPRPSAEAATGQSPNTATVVVVVADQTGASVPDAVVTATNAQTGLRREAKTSSDGSATLAALPIAGTYVLAVSKPGFATQDDVSDLKLRAGETATVRVKLIVGSEKSEVTVYGTTEGIREDPQLGRRLESKEIDETPLLGRKATYLPLLNAAFRPARGTGDLFVNAVYSVTGAGGRRETAVTMDGATNDDPWGRQTMMATIPAGAIQEMSVMSNAFSAEFGWTSSAAVNIVTKAGTNALHGEGLFLGRPGGMQATRLGTAPQCPPSIATCETPAVNGIETAILAPDIPDSLAQISASIGGPIAKDRTQYFGAFDYTHQDRAAPITSPLVPAGSTIVGRYRQGLFDGRIDHKLTSLHTLTVRANIDHFSDTNPQDVVSGNTLASAGRAFTRHTWSLQANETAILSARMVNEARFAYLDGDPITQFEPAQPSTQFTRAGSAPFTLGESRYAHIFSRQGQFSDTLTWSAGNHSIRLGGSAAHATSGGDGTEFGSPFVLGQFTVVSSTIAPFDQLTLSNMQSYTQGFNFGVGTYTQQQWLFAAYAQDTYRARPDLSLDLGLRYDRQTFSDATKNFAPRVGFSWSPAGDPRTAVRGGYGLYWTQLRSNLAANFELNGPLGIGSYSANPGQTGFPSCLTCTPVIFDPNAAAASLPARNVTIRPGRADFYTPIFARFGVDFARLPNYPSRLVNPKSQVASVGVEREVARGVFVSADYVRQHWTDLDRTVDLNAPTTFARTAPGQVRSAAAADATRPIAPVNGGFRQINVIMNLGVADYDGLQTMVSYRGTRRLTASLSYTLSKATNTTEPNGNGVNPNEANISALGEEERGPSLLDQRHRAVLNVNYRLPWHITAGTVSQFASPRPFNATTGVDNNGDRANNDRPVIDGVVAGKSSFRGTSISDVSLFAEGRVRTGGSRALLLRVEGFNIFNHANVFARNGVYGDGATPLATFGQATPGLAAMEPPRMVQFQARVTW
ncbi:MAG TPA: TonB-dependent receptor [Vicinamibacterales bacterium]|nr:TonB-dependent receptor [Vicinamibacterales bacterium]